MPEITIHQEFWSAIRKFLIESVVLFAAFLITIGLYEVEHFIIHHLLNISMNIAIYVIINVYPLVSAYHFLSFIRKSLRIAMPEPTKGSSN